MLVTCARAAALLVGSSAVVRRRRVIAEIPALRENAEDGEAIGRGSQTSRGWVRPGVRSATTTTGLQSSWPRLSLAPKVGSPQSECCRWRAPPATPALPATSGAWWPKRRTTGALRTTGATSGSVGTGRHGGIRLGRDRPAVRLLRGLGLTDARGRDDHRFPRGRLGHLPSAAEGDRCWESASE